MIIFYVRQQKSCLYGVGSSFGMGFLMKLCRDARIVYESRELFFEVHNFVYSAENAA